MTGRSRIEPYFGLRYRDSGNGVRELRGFGPQLSSLSTPNLKLSISNFCFHVELVCEAAAAASRYTTALHF